MLISKLFFIALPYFRDFIKLQSKTCCEPLESV